MSHYPEKLSSEDDKQSFFSFWTLCIFTPKTIIFLDFKNGQAQKGRGKVKDFLVDVFFTDFIRDLLFIKIVRILKLFKLWAWKVAEPRFEFCLPCLISLTNQRYFGLVDIRPAKRVMTGCLKRIQPKKRMEKYFPNLILRILKETKNRAVCACLHQILYL